MMPSFKLEEATIADIHAALGRGELTCRALVEAYLARIETIDRAGANLNAIVTVNPEALAEADRLDDHFARTGSFVGSLHGIPVLLKDQIETAGIATSFGSSAAAGHIPRRDATAIARLRRHGAIILAKTSMPDWATSWFAYSSRSGETRNPYALDRDPGGSSSGTAAAIAANLGAVGVGEDTGGSIRLPASFCNLVGLKVTPGLISRTGMSPLVVFQDSAGPMCRTVTDAALLLDALVGHDSEDPWTATAAIARPPASYAAALAADGLRGARIGVLEGVAGAAEDPDAAPVNEVIAAAHAAMRAAGAELVPLEVPDLMSQILYTSLYFAHSRHDINQFLAARPELGFTLDTLLAEGRYHPMLDLLEEIGRGPAVPEEEPDYFRKYAAREAFQRQIVNLMAEHQLEAITFPTVQVVPPKRASLNAHRWRCLDFPTNTLIAAQTWMPAMTVPAGFSAAGLPVGIEFLALPYGEPTLFRLGYAFEQATRHRRTPNV